MDLRMPNITGTTEREQLAQIRSYLYQFVPQLQWAINNLDTAVASSNYVVQQVKKGGSTEDTSQSPLATFNAIKSLIIKSADIVKVYRDEIITQLDGAYMAESDFGTYAEKTIQTILQTPTFTEQLFENDQVVMPTIDKAKEYQDWVIASKAHIKSGELYKDDNGYPVVGIEIGQYIEENGEEKFDKAARITAEKLSFYDNNDNEVAYVSDNKLYINSVEIKSISPTLTTPSYKIGGFADFVEEDGDVVTKWVGGNG